MQRQPLPPHPSAAQVRLADVLVAQQVDSGVFQGDLAGLQHIATVGDLQRLVGILLHQEHSHALLAHGVGEAGRFVIRVYDPSPLEPRWSREF